MGRRPTSADVAHRAGVSRTTVSFVLNERPGAQISEATRERVLAAAAELGYHAHASASSLAAGSSQTLGLVLRQSPEHVAVDALLPATLRGLTAAASGAGFRVLLESVPPGADGYSQLLRSGRVDGMVVSGPRSDDVVLGALAGEGYP
ncbi:MAG TPA: LacI family DNA-binding transcriptional regulator, partial [Candidatus Limnocylindrales bacterium]